MAKQEESVGQPQPAVQSQTPLSLTTEQLLLLLNEAKKPTQEEQVIQAKQLAGKRRQAEQDKASQEEIRKQKLWQITNCTHLRKDGTSRAMFIKGNPNRPSDYGYLHCQKCHANIYPEQALANGAPKSHILGAIYNTQMFNRLFQMTATSQISD